MPRLELERLRNPAQWAVHLHDGGDATADRALLDEAIATVARQGGGELHWWVSRPTEDHDRAAAAAGLRARRDLWQLRRPLPVEEPYHLDTRPFEVGRDEAAWLEVNNRAFASHPDQGGWTLETIAAREAEPWFDPAGFLLHERGGEGSASDEPQRRRGRRPSGARQQRRLAGFCWTKVHADHDPPLGEIFVIAVDPDFAGHGLGRDLVLAGLDHLWSVRGTPVGMLYVDAGNAPAVRLYQRLGFERHHVDRDYVADVAAR